MTVINNTTNSQFEIHFDDSKALMQYRLRDNTMYFMHTEVPDEKEGQGIGSKLAQFALDYARGHRYSIVVYCPFVKNYVQKHTEYIELINADKQDKSRFLT